MVEIFLSQGENGQAVTPLFQCHLVSYSRQGAEIALKEIMFESTHLALTPMGSGQLLLNINLPGGETESPFTVSAKPVWFNKISEEGLPPFRIGLLFTESLSSRQMKQINKKVL